MNENTTDYSKLVYIFADEINARRARNYPKTLIEIGERVKLHFDGNGSLVRLVFADERKQDRDDLRFNVTRARENLNV